METLGDWFGWARELITVALAIAFFLWRQGRAHGAREAQVDSRLDKLEQKIETTSGFKREQIQRVNTRLDEIRTFVVDAGKRMSDKVTQLQGFLSKAELLLRDVSELQKDTEKASDMLGTLRERIASCETVQKEQAAQRWKEKTR